jgi:5-methyltetrahydrofolate--homocysteine methyltransferase
MQREGMTLPLLIGGATTSKVHTALRIDPAYDGPVLHVLDASRAVGVASSLVSDTQRDPLVDKTADDYRAVRAARAGKGASDLATIEVARANAFPYDPAGKPPRPARPGSIATANGRFATSASRSTGRPSSVPGSSPATIPPSSTTSW